MKLVDVSSGPMPVTDPKIQRDLRPATAIEGNLG
jgi:hypothetical protein